MSITIPFFNKTSNKTRGVGIFLVLLIMTIISCPNADSGSSSGGDSVDSGPLVAVSVELIAGGGTTGKAEGTGENATFDKPRGMAVDTDGTIYVADNFNHSIRKITPGGVVSTYAGVSGTGGNAEGKGAAALFKGPTDILIKDTNTLYVMDDNGIREIVKETATVSPFATRANAKFGTSSGILGSIVRNPHTDTLYIIDPYDESTTHQGRVIEHIGGTTFNTLIDTHGDPISTIPLNTSHKFTDAVFDSAGNMYISTASGYSIITFNLTTAEKNPTNHFYPNHIKEVTYFVGSSTLTNGYVDGVGTAARFNGPTGMLMKGDYIYIADTGNHVIRMVQISTKTVTTMVGIPKTAGQFNGGKDVATFTRPQDLEFAPNGDIIVSEDHAIRRIVVEK